MSYPVMIHVAKALIHDADGNILILRRSGTHPEYAYQPDLPGGIIEPNEDIVTGLIREIEEEAGVTIDPSLLTVAFENKVAGEYIRHLYVARLDTIQPKITISWEHDQHEWLPTDEMLQKPIDQDTDSYYTQAIAWLKATRP